MKIFSSSIGDMDAIVNLMVDKEWMTGSEAERYDERVEELGRAFPIEVNLSRTLVETALRAYLGSRGYAYKQYYIED